MNRMKILLSAVLVFAATASIAQDFSDPRYAPWGDTPEQRKQNILTSNLLKEAVDTRDYDAAAVYFRTLAQEAPSASEATFKMCIRDRLCPRARVGIGHGKMPAEQLEKLIMDFIYGEFDVLISTTIVENGIDIPNANTIIVNNAQNFGLSDLHQLRGRVGRGSQRG